MTTTKDHTPKTEVFEEVTVPSIEDHETTTGHADSDGDAKGSEAKKPISLRLPVEDLNRAKALAGELDLGYQTLLCQVIHDGLVNKEEDLKYRKLVSALKASLPEFKAVEELASSPAVKAAQELLATPAIKAAQELLDSPTVKSAQELANTTTARVKEFGSTSASKAAQDLADSPVGKMLKDLTATPAFVAAQDLANSTGAKLARDWHNSPGGRLADAFANVNVVQPRAQVSSDELQALNKAVQDIQDALKKANLMA